MRRLTPTEMHIPAGGSTPGLVCNTTNSNAVSGNTTTSHSTEICQTSSGLTIITTTDKVTTTGEFSISGILKGMGALGGKAEWSSTTTDVVTCKPNGDCKSIHSETTSGPKSSDVSDGAAVDSLADFSNEDWGDSADWGDGGGWAGGDFDGMSGGSSLNLNGEYEVATC